MTYIRESSADIRVTINGVAFGDSWATYSGGGLEADSSKTRPGGMGREVSTGGLASRDDLEVTTQFTDIVAGWHAILESVVGSARVKVGVSWLGPDKLPTGQSFTRTGTLKAAVVPDADHMSSDVGMYSITVDCDELAA